MHFLNVPTARVSERKASYLHLCKNVLVLGLFSVACLVMPGIPQTSWAVPTDRPAGPAIIGQALSSPTTGARAAYDVLAYFPGETAVVPSTTPRPSGGRGGFSRPGGFSPVLPYRPNPSERTPEEEATPEPTPAPRSDPTGPSWTGPPRVVSGPEIVQVGMPRKVVPPRVRYLEELAMDIEKSVSRLTRKAPVEAAELYRNVAVQAAQRQDLPAERDALTRLGHVYYLTGQLRKASESYGKSLALSKRLKEPTREASALRNLAAASVASSDYAKAQEYNRAALSAFTESKNATAMAMTLNNTGVLEKRLGRYNAATKAYLTALEVGGESRDTRVLVLRNLGKLLGRRGYVSEATKYFDQAVEEARATDKTDQEAQALIDLVEFQRGIGEYDKALAHAERILSLFRRSGGPTDLAMRLMGELHLDRGKLDKAEPYVKKADYDSSLGRYFLLRGDLALAERHFRQLIASGQKRNSLDALFTAHTGLGKVYEALGDLPKAQAHYEQAVRVTEEIRSTVLLSERKSFFSEQVNGFARCEPAKALVRVMLKQGKTGESIYPSEVTKARGFADDLAQRAEGRQFGVPQEVLDEELHAVDKLAALKNARSIVPERVDVDRYTRLTDEIKKAQEEFKVCVKALRQRFGDYAAVRYPVPVTLEQASLGPSEYVIMFDQSNEGVAVRLVKGKSVLNAWFMDWKLQEQEKEVRAFRSPFESLRLRQFNHECATSLYRKLLADSLKLIPPGSTVTIIPDGLLALVPFEALVCEGTPRWKKGKWGEYPEGLVYVGDRYPIVYYQSLTAMSLIRKMHRERKRAEEILVMADPVYSTGDPRVKETRPSIRLAQVGNNGLSVTNSNRQMGPEPDLKLKRLPLTQELAHEIEKLYDPHAEVYTGMRCTKGAFLKRADASTHVLKALVFATHGFATNNVPGIMEPFLALTLVPAGTDGFLTMSEIAGMRLDADVAALVACETGVGRTLAGEGILSLGRSFQCAGVRSVVMSLWSVFEPSTVQLMNDFFSQLKQGKTKIQALRDARTHIRSAGFEHPFFWAAFVLTGETE